MPSVNLYVSLLGHIESSNLNSILPFNNNNKRIQIWCPTLKQPVYVLRKVIQATLFPTEIDLKKRKLRKNDNKLKTTIRIRLFFNGQELMDHYTIEDYELQDENVIQVKIDVVQSDEKKVTSFTSSPSSSGFQNQTSKLPITISSSLTDLLPFSFSIFEKKLVEDNVDPFYNIGDHIDALDQETGSWNPAIIKSIIKKNEFHSSYCITFRKQSLYGSGVTIQRTLEQIRPQSNQPISFDQLYPSQSILYLHEKRWFVAVIERVSQHYRKKIKDKKLGGKVWLNIFRPKTDDKPIAIEQLIVRYNRENFLKLEKNISKIERDARLEQVITKGMINKSNFVKREFYPKYNEIIIKLFLILNKDSTIQTAMNVWMIHW